MSDHLLFISHVTEDRPAAVELVDELERRGIPCWIAPRDIRPGEPFDDAIVAAIENALAMLLVFSDRCNDSDYIRREITVAGEVQRPVIPIRIEDAQPRRGLRMRLSDLHWIDAFVAREQAIDAIVRTVRPPATVPAKPPAAGAASQAPAAAAPAPPVSAPPAPAGKSGTATTAENYARTMLERAEAGDAKSCYVIAGYFSSGSYGMPRDPAKAVEYYRRAAQLGDAQAQQNLGFMYEHGRMVGQDVDEAVLWYRKSAEQGYYLAQSCLGSMHLAGKGVSRDPSEAAALFRKSAEQGYAWARYKLGMLCLDGNGIPQDIEAGLDLLRKAVHQDEPHAVCALAALHEEGRHVPKDLDAALKLYLRAADERNFPPAKVALKRLEREHGIARPKPVHAIPLPPAAELEEKLRGSYTVAPESESIAEMLNGNLAVIGRLGLLAVEPELQVYWHGLAAERGYPASQYQLGYLHHRGKGVARNLEVALDWYRKSAEQGFGLAQWALGNASRFGDGVPQDCAEALRWYRMAAERKHDLSMKTLGDLYQEGKCVEQDREEALGWYRKAAEHGNYEAKTILERLANEALAAAGGA